MAIDKMIRTRTMLFSSISPSKGNLLPSWGGKESNQQIPIKNGDDDCDREGLTSKEILSDC